ncbi:MAG: hypothetical protein A2Y33_13780 [Spirochaetes bacterium GWF1_51_8]|nr:MAG: hypothetical protein A2Y33_13780 [Spirochaetes bacterium GWF1_51_8]
MKKGYILAIILVGVFTGVIGFLLGNHFTPFNMMFRKAQSLAAAKDVETKKESIDVLNEAREFIDAAFLKLRTEETKQMFALAIGDMLIKGDMWLEASKYLDMAYAILPGDFSINYDLAFCSLKLYQIESDPAKKAALYQKTMHHAAIAYAERADNPNINYLMGVMEFDKGDLKKAFRHFSVIIGKYPNDVDALMAIARIYYEWGEYDKAQNIYIKLESILPADHPKFKQVEQNMQTLSGSMANE